MAVEPWNVVNLPPPSAASSCLVAFNAATADIIARLLSQREKVEQLLGSEVLYTELLVLYEILYVLKNRLRQHAPFRALKQVEQCINRLNELNLQQVLADLEELCPNKSQREDGLDMGHCNVPSQPTLEWICLKLLGASKLLCRTLDQCSKAFILTKQHLRLAEFIVLNLVLTSMLSRLWVFFRGILKALVPLYQSSMALCQVIALCQPMVYLKHFVLPADLNTFLGPQHLALLREDSKAEPLSLKRALKPSVLEKMFSKRREHEEGMEESEGSDEAVKDVLTSEGVNVKMDMGTAVLRQDAHYSKLKNLTSPGSSLGLDIKSVLQWTYGTKKNAHEAFAKTQPSMDPKAEITNQKKTFLRLLKSVSSFAETVVQLEEIIRWLRRRKLHQERRHLAFLLLDCRRMKTMESDGIRLQKKLRRFHGKVRRVILHGASPPRPSPVWRNKSTRFATLMARYGSVRRRLRRVRTCSHVAKDLFGIAIAAKSSQKDKKIAFQSTTVQSHDGQIVKEESLVCDAPLIEKEDKEDTKSAEKNEIDDIFASIEF